MDRAHARLAQVLCCMYVRVAVCVCIVAGDLPERSGDFPVRPAWEREWSPKTGVSLESAYRQVEGKEPDFTNNAKVSCRSVPRFCAAAPGLVRWQLQVETHALEGFVVLSTSIIDAGLCLISM